MLAVLSVLVLCRTAAVWGQNDTVVVVYIFAPGALVFFAVVRAAAAFAKPVRFLKKPSRRTNRKTMFGGALRAIMRRESSITFSLTGTL
jgi:hypothetical protein